MKKNYENSLREIIKEYNLKPKKKLGQNFLHDKNIISSIVNKANIEDEAVSYTHLTLPTICSV